jgi:hypothetical protein
VAVSRGARFEALTYPSGQCHLVPDQLSSPIADKAFEDVAKYFINRIRPYEKRRDLYFDLLRKYGKDIWKHRR